MGYFHNNDIPFDDNSQFPSLWRYGGLLKGLVVLQGWDYFLAEEFEGAHGVLVGQGAALGFEKEGADTQFLLDVAQLLDDGVGAADDQVILVLQLLVGHLVQGPGAAQGVGSGACGGEVAGGAPSTRAGP